MNKHKFIIKAIEDGWTVRKENNTYIFKRQHEGKHKYFLHSYLEKFLKKYS
jgi:imidazoleglycerol phosphate synthase glutamine amidotransferase subunit HisH